MGVYRKYCRICWYSGKCMRFAIAGAYKSSLNWGGILGAGVIGAFAELRGFSFLPGEGWQGIVASGLIYTAVAFLVIFLVRLVIAPFVIHRDGEWHGLRFVYREPQLGFSHYFKPSENNEVFRFRFKDAPPFSAITYKIVADGRSDFFSIVVAAHEKGLIEFTTHSDFQYTGGTVAVNKDRDMCAKAFLRPDADPFSIRIYVHSWEEHADPATEIKTADFEPARWG
ncbi:hypothetical protein [Bradyrhizobium retamae]|nr:hypothetical protein [Bradyrhizobium retamae]